MGARANARYFAADALERVASRVPRVGTWLDRIRPSTYSGWDRGFNGQRERQAMVREVAKAINFDAFVETGTFRGSTTAWVRQHLQLPVWTVELDERSYRFCRWRFRTETDVHLHQGDSRRFLREVAVQLPERRCLIYLDAHWYSDLPLGEEMRIVSSGWPEWVVMIDDFKVEGGHKYYFDDYGPGKSLELAILPFDALGDVGVFFPRATGMEERFPWRGCVVVGRGPDILASLRSCVSLREHSTET